MDVTDFGLTWHEAFTVAGTAVGLYLLFVIVVRLLGQRMLGTMSSIDVIVVITMGAVLGRAILGISTDLLGGAVALLTLLAIQAVFWQMRRWPPTERLVRNPPMALVVDGRFHEQNLRRTHLDQSDVWARMRVAGIRSPDEIALMVLESTGQVSVIRAGGPVDARILEEVRGVKDL